MLIEYMTWEEVARSIDEQHVLLIPIGSIEQHGPHLPLGTDLHSVLGIAKLVAEQIDAVVAPPIYYTYTKSMRSFPGTVAIEATTLMALLRDIVHEFIRQGFKNILFLSGHYENLAFIQEGVQVAVDEVASESAKVVIATWWDVIPEETVANIFGEDWVGWAGGHASMAETSLAMALNPQFVRDDKIVDDKPAERLPYDVFPLPSKRLPKSGVFSKTTPSSKETGTRLRDEVLKEVLNLIQREFKTDR